MNLWDNVEVVRDFSSDDPVNFVFLEHGGVPKQGDRGVVVERGDEGEVEVKLERYPITFLFKERELRVVAPKTLGYVVVDTKKDGGHLVPLNGVIYEKGEDASQVYRQAVKEIYGGALGVYELVDITTKFMDLRVVQSNTAISGL